VSGQAKTQSIEPLAGENLACGAKAIGGIGESVEEKSPALWRRRFHFESPIPIPGQGFGIGGTVLSEAGIPSGAVGLWPQLLIQLGQQPVLQRQIVIQVKPVRKLSMLELLIQVHDMPALEIGTPVGHQDIEGDASQGHAQEHKKKAT
jgi:hypothetical protein